MTKLEELENKLVTLDERIDELEEKILDCRNARTKIEQEIEKAKDENRKGKYAYLVGKYWYFETEREGTTIEVYLKVNYVFNDFIAFKEGTCATCESIELCHVSNTNDLQWLTYMKKFTLGLGNYYDSGWVIPVDKLEETTEEKFILAKQTSLL